MSHLILPSTFIIHSLFVWYVSVSRFYLIHNLSYFSYCASIPDIFILIHEVFWLQSWRGISQLCYALLSLPVETSKLMKWLPHSRVGIWRLQADTCARFTVFCLGLIVDTLGSSNIALSDIFVQSRRLCWWQRFLSEPIKSDWLTISVISLTIDSIIHLFREFACKAKVFCSVCSSEWIWIWDFLLVFWVDILALICCTWLEALVEILIEWSLGFNWFFHGKVLCDCLIDWFLGVLDFVVLKHFVLNIHTIFWL